MRTLPILRPQSNSSLNCFRRCPAEYNFRYNARRIPRKESFELRFGKFVHLALNAWWGEPDRELRLDKALEEIQPKVAQHFQLNDYEAELAAVMLMVYDKKWREEPYETVAVEREFNFSSPSGFNFRGRIDAVAKRNGNLFVVEHKTTSQSIEQGSDYWKHVSTLDSQVSLYLVAQEANGEPCTAVLYDVLKRPRSAPYKATPPELRKYTKAGQLHKGQHEHDETVAEYGVRMLAELSEKASEYFRREVVYRLTEERDRFIRDADFTCQILQVTDEGGLWPLHEASCKQFGRLCEYHDVCSGADSIENNHAFQDKEQE